jgi:hypothetical protein
MHVSGIRGSSVGIATSYRLDVQTSNPGSLKIYLYSTASRPGLRPSQQSIQWVLGTFPTNIERPERETRRTSPCSTKEHNGGTTHVHSSICLHIAG